MFKPDLLSLIIGITAGILLTLFIKRRNVLLFFKKHKHKAKKKSGINRNDEQELRKFLLREAESSHLLAFFCRLSDLFISRKLISNPLYLDPSVDIEEIHGLLLKPLAIAEIPELAIEYPFPLLSLGEALSGGCNVVLKGRIGSGKSCTIANLVIELLEGRCPVVELNQFLPIFIHARNLTFSGTEKTLENAILDSIGARSAINKKNGLEPIIEKYRSQKRLLLCLDGLDELEPEEFDEYVIRIQEFLIQNPSVQIITVSGPFYTGNLIKAGFVSFYLKPPSLEENKRLALKICGLFLDNSSLLEKEVVQGWVKQFKPSLELFSTTIQVFSYLFPSSKSEKSFVEPYIRYVTGNKLSAHELVLLLRSYAHPLENGSSLFQSEGLVRLPPSNDVPSLTISGEKAIDALINNRVLISNPDGHLRLLNAELNCHLLAMSDSHPLVLDPARLLCSPIEDRITQLSHQTHYLGEWVQRSEQINDMNLLLTLEHILVKKNKKVLCGSGLEKIAKVVTSLKLPLSTRYLAANLIFYSQENILFYLLKHFSSSTDIDTSQLIILLVGLSGEAKYADLLAPFLSSDLPMLRELALLMLIRHPELDRASLIDFEMHGLGGQNIGVLMSLEGDEGLEQLQRYATLEDSNCRRNAIAGLRIINQYWSVKELHHLNSTDHAWMVRDAAAQAIENQWSPAPFIPRPLPPLGKNPTILHFLETISSDSPYKGNSSDLLGTLIHSQDYPLQLLGLRYLIKQGGSQIPAALEALVCRPGNLREVALLLQRDLFYANCSLSRKVL